MTKSSKRKKVMAGEFGFTPSRPGDRVILPAIVWFGTIWDGMIFFFKKKWIS
jgi:hypothetical protein